jgi:hypothetical protein
LRRAVIWDGERVDDGLQASGGVFAGGKFHRCDPPSQIESARKS